MSHEHMQRIEELAQAIDHDTERPTDPRERLEWLSKHRTWLHLIQEITLEELESTYHQEQVARGELYGA